MEIKIGSRIVLNNEFIKKIVSDTVSSKTFVITAMTDCAIGIKNIRSGRSYTVRIEDIVDNRENFETVKPRKTGSGAILDLPPIAPKPITVKPVEPTIKPEPKYEDSVPVVVEINPVVKPIEAEPIKPQEPVDPAINVDPEKDDLFGDLYG